MAFCELRTACAIACSRLVKAQGRRRQRNQVLGRGAEARSDRIARPPTPVYDPRVTVRRTLTKEQAQADVRLTAFSFAAALACRRAIAARVANYPLRRVSSLSVVAFWTKTSSDPSDLICNSVSIICPAPKCHHLGAHLPAKQPEKPAPSHDGHHRRRSRARITKPPTISTNGGPTTRSQSVALSEFMYAVTSSKSSATLVDASEKGGIDSAADMEPLSALIAATTSAHMSQRIGPNCCVWLQTPTAHSYSSADWKTILPAAPMRSAFHETLGCYSCRPSSTNHALEGP